MVRLFRSIGALFAAVWLAAGCAGQLPPPSAADAARGGAQFPGITVDDLTRGRQLYIEHCSGCHALVRPLDKGPEIWPRVVEEMASRAKLSAAGVRDITRYLMVASAAPR